ncbi:IS1016 transposase [Neisseria zoodegmatis]|uniref:IS1016 transposase n=1 Tax=Neisseria zoodegmatis TaxID=326523 RepID=A0A378WEU0_9NEIS|nr:IS1016 transposase [Neisseria zoodegmatis]
MKITHCKLKKSLQRKLLEYFVLEVTARSAADILGIQPNTAILFYRKIRLVISHHLALEADQVFEGTIELDEAISAVSVKESAVGEQQVKWWFSVSLNVEVRFIRL